MFDWIGNKFDEFWNSIKFITIYDFEEGVLYRNGKFRKKMHPGIHPRIPFFDDYRKVNIRSETFQIAPINITTTDGKTISVSATYERHIHDSIRFIQQFNGPDGNLHDLSRGIMANYLTECTWEQTKTKDTQAVILNRLTEECNRMGVTVTKFAITDIALSRMFIINPTYKKEP